VVDNEFVGRNLAIKTLPSAAQTSSLAHFLSLDSALSNAHGMPDSAQRASFQPFAYLLLSSIYDLMLPLKYRLGFVCWNSGQPSFVSLLALLAFCASCFYEMISPRLFRSGLGNTHGPFARSAQFCFRLMDMLTLMMILEYAYPVVAGGGSLSLVDRR